ncbi:MAG TPA: hypothetical protein EYQ07_06425 [Candidatus Poseidoniales archaeon]|nr:hypothetical protein [Candidatus Poseidoniales archaeon]
MPTDRDAALLRVRLMLFSRERDEGNGMRIPALVNAVLGEESDDGIIELVKTALAANQTQITMPEMVDGIIALSAWRDAQT